MKKTLTLLLLLPATMLCAQDNTSTTSQQTNRVKVYTPSSSTANKKVADTYKWVVKTDVFGMLYGEFPIIGEYRIAKKISVEGTVGFTFDFLGDWSAIFDDYSDHAESEASIGRVLRGGFKYYPSSDYDALEGWAFGVQAFNKINKRDYTSAELAGKQSVRSKTGVALTISRQIFWESNISFETFLSGGLSSVDKSRYDWEYDMNGERIAKEYTSNKMTPHFQFGIRIGFGN